MSHLIEITPDRDGAADLGRFGRLASKLEGGATHDGLHDVTQLALRTWTPTRSDSDSNREDSEGADAVDQFRIAQHAQLYEQLKANRPDLAPILQRIDAEYTRQDREDDGYVQGNGYFFARQLEYRFSRVLEEILPPLSGIDLFRRDASVPVGAKSYTIRRRRLIGEAAIHGLTNVDVPVSDYAMAEQTRAVKFIATSVRMTLPAMLAGEFANENVLGGKMLAARRAAAELINRLIWNGHDGAQLLGILNYPWLARVPISTNFSSDTGDNILAALNLIANYPRTASNEAMMPNRMATSGRIARKLMQTRLGSVSDITIADFFYKGGLIKSIDVAPELKNPYGTGQDGILVWNDQPGTDSLFYVAPQGLTMLPAQNVMYDQLIPMWASFGGVNMPNVGNNALALVTPPTY